MSDWVSKLIFSGQFKQYTHLLSIDAPLSPTCDLMCFGMPCGHDYAHHHLSYINWATFVRVTRSSMLETLRQDYVVTARAKGLKGIR